MSTGFAPEDSGFASENTPNSVSVGGAHREESARSPGVDFVSELGLGQQEPGIPEEIDSLLNELQEKLKSLGAKNVKLDIEFGLPFSGNLFEAKFEIRIGKPPEEESETFSGPAAAVYGSSLPEGFLLKEGSRWRNKDTGQTGTLHWIRNTGMGRPTTHIRWDGEVSLWPLTLGLFQHLELLESQADTDSGAQEDEDSDGTSGCGSYSGYDDTDYDEDADSGVYDAYEPYLNEDDDEDEDWDEDDEDSPLNPPISPNSGFAPEDEDTGFAAE